MVRPTAYDLDRFEIRRAGFMRGSLATLGPVAAEAASRSIAVQHASAVHAPDTFLTDGQPA